jgi:hypothetical protein
MERDPSYQFSKSTDITPNESDKERDPLGILGDTEEGELSDEEVEQRLGFLIEEENDNDPLGIRNVEVVENNESNVSFGDLWDRVADKIVDITPNFIVDKDKVVNAYIALMNRSVDLSKSAGKFYNFLAKHGHTKPDKEHTFQETQSVLELRKEYGVDLIYSARDEHSRKSQSLKAERSIVEGRLSEKAEEQPIFRSSEQREDHKFEMLTQIVNQEGQENTVEEVVFNSLYDDWNYSSANLYVHNKKTGQAIELSELLPAGFTFMPAKMREIKEELVRSGEGDERRFDLKRTIVPLSLADYKGTQEGKDKFYANPALERVGYGDLVKKGGLLSLLHEIGHAWQSKYHSNMGRANWEEFYSTVTMQLEMLQSISKLNEEREEDEERDEDMAEEIRNWELNWTKEKLAAVGASIQEDYVYTDQPLEGDKYKVTSTGTEKEGDDYLSKKHHFYIQSDKIKPLVEDFVREERDAWAHALRVLRFLRQQGFDLEPELKTVKDIQDIVHHCLGTYQASIEMQLEPTKNIRKFTRKSRFDIEEYKKKLKETPEEGIVEEQIS